MTDLVAGSGIGFEDRGDHQLKGVPGTWRLFSVKVLVQRIAEPARLALVARYRARLHPPTRLRTQRPRCWGAGFRIEATSASKIDISGGRRARAAASRTNSRDAGARK